MRVQSKTVAVAATVFSLAGGGGVAWACTDRAVPAQLQHLDHRIKHDDD